MREAEQHTPDVKGDWETVERIRLGDQQAVAQMYRRYARYVAAIAYRLSGDDADLEDIVQDTFMAAVKGIGNLHDSAVLKTWLATIAVRTASRYADMRKKHRQLAREKYIDPHSSAEPTHVVGVELRELLAKIPWKYRAPWILSSVMEMKLQETSDACGCSLATTKRRIQKAEKLIRRLRDEF